MDRRTNRRTEKRMKDNESQQREFANLEFADENEFFNEEAFQQEERRNERRKEQEEKR